MRIRDTNGALVTGVQTCALPICDFTGNFGLTWEPSSDQTYYASFSRGIKGVGFNNGFSAFDTLAANVATLGPVGQEVLDAFELGAKNRFFDRRLSVNTDRKSTRLNSSH